MKRSRLFPIMIFSACLNAGAGVRASIIVDHQPFNTGGFGSDTLFTSPFGQQVWQQVADDFVWNSAEQLTGVNFWGFYNADNPPASETIRLRIYEPRASDGLPGQVKFELAVQNSFRVATGRVIQVGVTPNEYRFEEPLPTPVDLVEDDSFWLEIVQLGDVTTHFRWETSVSDNDQFAIVNISVPDWLSAQGQGEQAFQLISPEPTSAALYGFAICYFIRARSRRTICRLSIRLKRLPIRKPQTAHGGC